MSAEIATPINTQQARKGTPTVVIILAAGLVVALTAGLTVMKKNRVMEVKESAAKLNTDAELGDFADHPDQWKGKTVAAKVFVRTAGDLSGNLGKTVECKTYNRSSFQFNLDIPADAVVPNHNGTFYVVFKCNEGKLDAGNVLISAKRN